MRFSCSLVLCAFLLAAVTGPADAKSKPKVAKPAKTATAKAQKPVKAPKAEKPKVEKPKVEKVAKAKTPARTVPERRAWMFGANYGYAGTRFVNADNVAMIAELRTDTPAEFPPLVPIEVESRTNKIEPSASVQFRLGYMVSPKLMIGFERLTWFKDYSDNSWRFSTSTISATWYPAAGHFFMRGGAGLSGMVIKAPVVDPLFLQIASRGVSLEGALGYERRLLGRVTIAPEVSLRSMNFGQNIRAQIGAASLGFNWWF